MRVLQLRTLRGGGGGPERTILAYAAGGGPPGVEVSVCYVRNRDDAAFTIDVRAARMGVDYREIRERGAVDLLAWRELEKLVRELRPDVIHCHDYKANFLGLWLARRMPVALVSTSHGWADVDARGRWLYYPADRLLLRRFPLVVAVSDAIRGLLLRSGVRPANVVVVRNGVDVAAMVRSPARSPAIRESLGIAPDAAVVGVVGRLDGEKRLDLVLTAVARLRARGLALAVLVVGDGSMRAEWTELAHRLGIADFCRFLGTREDVADLHHAMDVYVQSSQAEGTSNALLEAMAMQTPIVATAVGGTAELVEDGVHGLLVAPNDARALEVSIERVLADREGALHRAAAARARAETEFSLALWKSRMSKIYRDLVASPATDAISSVSYVIPARNEAANIRRAVETILAQPVPLSLPLEVLVVDNGSTDATAALASAAGARVVVSQADGPAGARNDGAWAAKGDLLCFIDADCAVAPDHLEHVLHVLSDGASAAGAACVPPRRRSTVQHAWALQRSSPESRDVDWISSANFAIRRGVFEDVGGFDEGLVTCEDSDIGYRLGAMGHRMRCDPAIVVVHHREPVGLREFFSKEVWRGRDSLRSFLAHGRPPREIPSLAFPLAAVGCPVAGCIVAGAGASHAGVTIAAVGLLLPVVAAVRTSIAQRDWSCVGTLAFLYSAWALARFVALAKEILVMLAPGYADIVLRQRRGGAGEAR